MIGDQHLDTALARGGHAGVAGDAIVDGHDEGRRPRRSERDDLGSEPVSELEAVRHEEIGLRAHFAQRQ